MYFRRKKKKGGWERNREREREYEREVSNLDLQHHVTICRKSPGVPRTQKAVSLPALFPSQSSERFLDWEVLKALEGGIVFYATSGAPSLPRIWGEGGQVLFFVLVCF